MWVSCRLMMLCSAHLRWLGSLDRFMPSLDKFRLLHVVSFLCMLFLVVQVFFLKGFQLFFQCFFVLSCYRLELSASKMSKSVLFLVCFFSSFWGPFLGFFFFEKLLRCYGSVACFGPFQVRFSSFLVALIFFCVKCLKWFELVHVFFKLSSRFQIVSGWFSCCVLRIAKVVFCLRSFSVLVRCCTLYCRFQVSSGWLFRIFRLI